MEGQSLNHRTSREAPVVLFVPWVPVSGGRFSDVSVLPPQVTLLIAFICVRTSLWTSYSAYSYFEVVTICNLIMILAFYLVHLFRLHRVLTCISWPLSVRERPGRPPPARVRTQAGCWDLTASFPSTRPASVAASALNFPPLGGPLCLLSYWPLKLTFKLQEGCASHHMLVFSSDRKWAERGVTWRWNVEAGS